MSKKRRVLYGITAGAAALSMMISGINSLAAAGDNANALAIETIAAEIDLSNAVELKIENGTIPGLSIKDGIEFDGSTLKINKAGTYVLSGQLKGKIKVSASKKEEVVLVLNGLTVINETEAALEVKKTSNVTILLNDRTENVFSSGIETEIDGNSAAAAAANTGAAVELKAGAVITGTGKLIVNGYVNNGITSSSSLTVDAGNIVVTAVNNGIKVKENLILNGGNIDTLTGGDSIKAEKEAVEAADAVVDEVTGQVITEAIEAEEAAGTITINGSYINIDSFGDAITAMLDLTVNDGTINIKTEGDYDNSISRGESSGGAASDEVSEKGLKSQGTINICGGTITINSKDDAVHCAEKLLIEGGEITINSGDDGLHSDTQLDINGGSVDIQDSYEGIEANQIHVSGGNISVIASDDGFNASGGSDSFGGSANQAANQKMGKETPNLIITGGNVYVNAKGDGLDSNGNLTIQGGYIIVDGPEDSGNGPLDSGSENGGTITVSGGTIIAVGSSGMAEGFESTSSQYSIKLVLSTTFKAGTDVKVADMTGKVIFSYTTAKTGNSIVFSSPELKKDEDVIITVGDVDYQITLSSISTVVSGAADGTITEGSNGGSQGGPGGGSDNREQGDSPERAADGERPSFAEGESPEGPQPGDSQGEQGKESGDSQQGEQGQRPGNSQPGQQGQQPGNSQPEETQPEQPRVQEAAEEA